MKKRLLALWLLLALLLSGCEIVYDLPPETYAAIPEETAASAPEKTASGADAELLVHFIDVGQADCALLEYEGQYMLIDGGNREDGQLVVSYLQEQGVEELEAVVCSHAHEDHVGGLPSVLAVFPTKVVYAPTNDYASSVFDDFLYYVGQQGLEVTIPSPGDTVSLGEVTATVLGPVKTYADPNNTSIVLRVAYGDTALIFTGDMETEAENDMLDYWEGQEALFSADVLKVGHHGSYTSTGYRFLYRVMPTYGVISVGAGNSYGHPHEEPMSRLEQAGVTILRTDTLGHILAHSDGESVYFTWQNQSANPENAQPAQPEIYIGNRNSMRFHSPYCGSLPSQKNRVEFDSYEAAIAAGYSPCSGCLG